MRNFRFGVRRTSVANNISLVALAQNFKSWTPDMSRSINSSRETLRKLSLDGRSGFLNAFIVDL